MLLNPNDPDYQQKLAAAQNVAPRDRATNALYENVGSIGGGGLTQTAGGNNFGGDFNPAMAMPGYDTAQQISGLGLVGGSSDVKPFVGFGDDLGILGRPTPYTGGQLIGTASPMSGYGGETPQAIGGPGLVADSQRPTSFQNETPQPIGTFNTQMGSAQDDPLFNLRQYNSQNSPSNAYQNIPSQGFGGASQSFGQGANGYSAAGASSGGGAGAGGGAVFPLQGNYGIVKLQSGGAVGQMQTADKLQFISGNMYPGSQQDRTQYATPSQMPAGAQAVAIKSDYDSKVNPITGEPMASFAKGGIAALRFNGKDGSSVFDDDPNNFASDITNAYQTLWGRAPTDTELRANVDALNKNPDAFGFVVDKLANDPNAAKFYAQNAKPTTDSEGNEVAPASYDPEAAAQQLYAGYGKWTPREEAGGIQGFMNRVGPVLPLALAIPAIAAAAAPAAGALTTADILGSTFAGSQFAIDPALAYTAAAGSGLGAGAAGSGSWGLTPELAAELGLDYSSSGLSTSGELGSKALESMGLNTAAGGLSAKQAYAAKTAMDLLTKGTGEASQYASAPSYGSSAPSVMPNVSHGGATGYAGAASAPDYRSIAALMPSPYLSKISGVPGSYTFAQGGIANLGGYSDGGQLLRGPGDGMSDNIPASIGGKQPARLADGEFVVPADVVSHLGNGSTDAGAKQLYKMMDKIRKARTGTKKQGKQINPNKFLP